MNAVIEITHHVANVTYVRDATVSQWLAAARRPPAISRWNVAGKLLAVAAGPCRVARSNG